MHTPSRLPSPSDVSDEEWAFVAPYLSLLAEHAGPRRYPLREVFNGRRWPVHTGAPGRLLPHDLPPWALETRGILQATGWPGGLTPATGC